MAKRATIEDIAARVGVHPATVSRALNERTASQVKATTRARIQKVAREVGYVPNILARGLITLTSASVGVLVPDLTNPLFPPIVRGIEAVLAPRGYTTLIANTDSDDDKERAAFDALLARRVDGFIVATGHTDHTLLRQAYERGVRVVTVNRGSPDAPFPLVTADNSEGIRAVLAHLIELGHTRITHLAGPPGLMTSAARADSFVKVCAAHVGVHAEVVLLDALTIEQGESATRRILASDSQPTALVAGNDLVAIGALRAARAASVVCPDDISITGFNDIPLAEDLGPPLSTVHVPHFDMGVHAARLLLDQLSAAETAPVTSPATVTLPVSFVERASTAPPRQSA
jgi:LacI family transcriptional regulator